MLNLVSCRFRVITQLNVITRIYGYVDEFAVSTMESEYPTFIRDQYIIAGDGTMQINAGSIIKNVARSVSGTDARESIEGNENGDR
eukprot:UN06034